jgi:hypothetical protein
MSDKSWDEYQAIVRRPASILDSPQALELGYVLEPGPIRRTQQKAVDAALSNATESHASLFGMRWRIVEANEWDEIEL